MERVHDTTSINKKESVREMHTSSHELKMQMLMIIQFKIKQTLSENQQSYLETKL